MGGFITAPGSTIQDFLTKPRGAFVRVPGGPIALHARNCLGDKVRHMPSLLMVGVLGNVRNGESLVHRICMLNTSSALDWPLE